MLNDFSKGLEALDVLSAIRTNPAAFETLFVASTEMLSPNAVKKALSLKFSLSGSTESETIFSMLKKFIDESDEKGSISFLDILKSMGPLLSSK